MKTQRFTGALAAISLLGLCSSTTFGNTVVIDRLDASVQGFPGGNIYGGATVTGVSNETSQGGEFTLIPSDPTILNQYASVAKVTDPDSPLTGQVGFQSFCLETGLSYPGSPALPTSPLNYVISPNILNASTYQPGLTITLGTAWLYSEFATGKLTGYAYTNTAATESPNGYTSARAADAAYLQAAIWYLEDQAGCNTLAEAGGAANPFLNLLTAPTSSGGLGLTSMSLAFAPDAGGYGVDVMNIGTVANNYGYQAQLVMTDPVPDGGATLMLLGVAAGGLALLRRKLGA